MNKKIIKHSIVLFVCFFCILFIYYITDTETWGWDWGCFFTICLISSTVILSLIIVGIISIVNLIKTSTLKYKLSIGYKERCYKKIDRLHSYLERGSITQEEFEELKQGILDTMKQ